MHGAGIATPFAASRWLARHTTFPNVCWTTGVVFARVGYEQTARRHRMRPSIQLKRCRDVTVASSFLLSRRSLSVCLNSVSVVLGNSPPLRIGAVHSFETAQRESINSVAMVCGASAAQRCAGSLIPRREPDFSLEYKTGVTFPSGLRNRSCAVPHGQLSLWSLLCERSTNQEIA